MPVPFDARVVRHLEQTYAAPDIVEQRVRTRAALAVQSGEHGLDVGCGPGFLTCELARDVGPTGRVVAVDSSEDMLTAARARAEREGLAGRVELRLGEATRLPCETAALDFVVGVQVYLYVAPIETALAEAARVLRPGGRLAVVETDWDACLWLTSDPARHRRVMAARMAQFVNPHLPPVLPGLLRDAGLRLTHASAIPIVNVRNAPGSFSAEIIGVTRAAAIRQGVPEAEADAWAADLRARTDEGDYFFSVNRFLFVAIKPGGA